MYAPFSSGIVPHARTRTQLIPKVLDAEVPYSVHNEYARQRSLPRTPCAAGVPQRAARTRRAPQGGQDHGAGGASVGERARPRYPGSWARRLTRSLRRLLGSLRRSIRRCVIRSRTWLLRPRWRKSRNVRSVVDSYLLLIYFHCFRASLGSLATVLAPSGTRPRFTTPYRRHVPPLP